MKPLDSVFMRRALSLARAQLGRVAPNPAVGCVIVRAEQVCGEAATDDGGRPHAEELALREAGEAAAGADIYITLEPCARRSDNSPSCAQRILAARPARVLIACQDPHPQAAGAGLALLRAGGIAIELGMAAAEAEALNIGFFTKVKTGLPFFALSDHGDDFDAEMILKPEESFEAGLKRMGKAGITRVFARHGSASAEAFARACAARSTRS
jgi:diaminohydroxyphosphoribosylaminopyrimidine deaminase / 5-amino-6-(5-phosphoribosylamino)uracil reductase